ncbi:MAG: YiiX/YebB-like N1pC/P60 family cysteine hydrolase [Myxococcota bacterium]
MPRSLRGRIRDWLTARLTHFLNQPAGHYEQHHPNDVERLARTIRKGDVLLVEGHQRVSAMIKYLTHSSWSHAALYVGDELVRRGGPLRELAVEHFGDEAETLVVEALTEGVVASPLSKYTDHNVRICRPHRLRNFHLDQVIDEAVASIGLRYDLKNVAELAIYLMRISLLPVRFRRRALRLGSGLSGQVICTSLIGQIFQNVGFPVLPQVSHPRAPGHAPPPRRSRWNPFAAADPQLAPYGGGVYRRRHPTLLMPRDFDLSPFFEIVKFNVIAEKGFDYERIEWEDDGEEVA